MSAPSPAPSPARRVAARIARLASAAFPRRRPRDRGVDIVVPVHDAREHVVACVESVLRHARGDWRLVIVDDASRDPTLVAWLDRIAQQQGRVVLLRHPANRGFVASANRGFAHAAGRDVLLLNSDTVVTEGFLARLAACAHATSDTGLVSPFTNNGTICSLPRLAVPNEIPVELGVDGMAELVRRVSRRLYPELITAVGFCMYVRAEVLESVGGFDERRFGRGYGEENDLSLRARAAGFRIRLCDDLFIAHVGGASFGDESSAGEQRGNETLQRLYPGYHEEVQRFLRENPLAAARDPILAALADLDRGSPHGPAIGRTPFEVRGYRSGDEAGILALFERVFPVERNMEHWQWKFAANPEGRHISLAVDEHGEIIGQFAGLPVAAHGPWGPFVLSQGVDHMVHPAHQGRGVFAALTRHFLETVLRSDPRVVFYSYPLAHKHSIDERITAAELVHPVRSLVFALEQDEAWRREPGHRLGRLRYRVERVGRFDASADRLWRRTRDELSIAAVRDARYLNWRYVDCPDVEYTALRAVDRLSGGVAGIAVLRFGWFDEPIAPIVEWLVPARDRVVGGLLLAACHDLARERGLRSTRIWLPASAAAHAVLRAHGYEATETPFLLTTLADANRERASAMARSWYYTMGDSDIY